MLSREVKARAEDYLLIVGNALGFDLFLRLSHCEQLLLSASVKTQHPRIYKESEFTDIASYQLANK